MLRIATSGGFIRTGAYIGKSNQLTMEKANSPQEFFSQAQNNPALLNELMPLLAKFQDPDANDNDSIESLNGIIKLASEYKYTFTTEDLDQYFADLSGEAFRASLSGELELSDYDLELVAGGKGGTTTAVTVTTATATARFLCA